MEITSRQLEIIEAAGKILTVSGVTGLTINKLAKEMHFSESALYRHFSSKEEIIIAMLNYLSDNIDARLTKVNNSEANSEEKFSAIFQNQFVFFGENPHFVVAVFSDGLMEESTRINETILSLLFVKIKHLLPIIIEGQKSGIFRNDINADEFIQIIMGTFRLQMFKWRIDNFQFDIHSEGNKMINTLLSLIKIKQ
ncbi:MAG: TetR/AcrR family transcriptional regulator [Paludibacter sp.]|nr:TetR/AcrR family transcriptional regulator [Paludibacter sp.]